MGPLAEKRRQREGDLAPSNVTIGQPSNAQKLIHIQRLRPHVEQAQVRQRGQAVDDGAGSRGGQPVATGATGSSCEGRVLRVGRMGGDGSAMTW